MLTTIIAFILIVIAILAMAIGVIVKRSSKGELKGSCGGPNANPKCCQKKDCSKNL